MKIETAIKLRKGDKVSFRDKSIWSGSYPLLEEPEVTRHGEQIVNVTFLIKYYDKAQKFCYCWFMEPDDLFSS